MQLRPLGDGFIQLIKMIIAPLIFLAIVTGISAVGDVKAVGRVGVKALLYFTAATLFALVFGLIVGNIVQPGAGLNIDPSTLSQEAVDAKTGHAVPKDAAAFILDVIPTSVIGAFANNSLLQVLFFSVFFGAAIVVIGRERCMPVISLMETVLELIFKIMSWIMKVAPIGAFGAMAFIIGQYGIDTLSTYALLIAACYGAAIVFIGLLFLVAWGFARVPLWHFLKYTREEFLLALGTASTEAVMPRIMTKLTNAGCSTSHHRPGGSHRLFVQPRRRRDLPFDLPALPGTGLRPQPGPRPAAGRARCPAPDLQGHGRRARLLVLALSATAAALGIFPVAGVAPLLGADRLMDSMRVVVNLLGNCVATFVVSKWEGQFDRSVMVRAFRGEITNHDSAIMLGVEDDFEDQELARISGGEAPSPKFRGGPDPEDIPGFQMSPPARAYAGPPERSSAAINHE